MKLSEYPLLSNPSANAIIPVIDGGSNWTYPLGSIGGSSGSSSIILASDVATVSLGNINKNSFYKFFIAGVLSAAGTFTLSIDGLNDGNAYINRFHYAGSSVSTGAGSGLIGLHAGYSFTNVPYFCSGNISTVNFYMLTAIQNRLEGDFGSTHALTTRTGRLLTPLSNISGNELGLTFRAENGTLKAGTVIRLSEV